MQALELGNVDAQQINTMKLSNDIEIRVGPFGAYVKQGESDTGKFFNSSEIIAPNELKLKLVEELLAKPPWERKLGIDPQLIFQ